jgi:hypothetical protein
LRAPRQENGWCAPQPWQSGWMLHIRRWPGTLVRGWRWADEIIFIVRWEMAILGGRLGLAEGQHGWLCDVWWLEWGGRQVQDYHILTKITRENQWESPPQNTTKSYFQLCCFAMSVMYYFFSDSTLISWCRVSEK